MPVLRPVANSSQNVNILASSNSSVCTLKRPQHLLTHEANEIDSCESESLSGVISIHGTLPSNCTSSLSPLKPHVWAIELVGDPDHDFLLNGVTNGFALVDQGAVIDSYHCNNY